MADVAGENQCYSGQGYILGLQLSDLDQQAWLRPLLNMHLTNGYERRFEQLGLELQNVMLCGSFK